MTLEQLNEMIHDRQYRVYYGLPINGKMRRVRYVSEAMESEMKYEGKAIEYVILTLDTTRRVSVYIDSLFKYLYIEKCEWVKVAIE